jgi:hypothetical protein
MEMDNSKKGLEVSKSRNLGMIGRKVREGFNIKDYLHP